MYFEAFFINVLPQNEIRSVRPRDYSQYLNRAGIRGTPEATMGRGLPSDLEPAGDSTFTMTAPPSGERMRATGETINTYFGRP
jgi:hypothetical protein